MIVDLALYAHGRRTDLPWTDASQDLTAVLAQAKRTPGDFVWLGICDPTKEEIAAAQAAFGLHPLAIDDTQGAHQRPKVEHYEHHLFVILKTLWYVEETDAVETGELAVFVGEDFVVTVRRGHGITFDHTRAWLEGRTDILSHGPWAVLYALSEHVVQGHSQVVAELETDVDEIEESVFSASRTNDSQRIYTLKREVAEVRRAVVPLRDPMRQFAQGLPGLQGTPEAARPYFRSVADDVARVAETVDALDGLLSTAFDAHVARISVQQNEDMRKISAGAALVVVPTLIAGIYGMNFEHMPELSWTYGYVYALTMMVVSAVVLWWVFRRSGWW